MTKNKISILSGIFILTLGVIFLGNNLNLWNIEIFFNGWWTLIIIIPSLLGFVKKEGIIPSTLGLSIGILLLLAAQNIISWEMVGKIFISILIIVIGLFLIFNPIRKTKIKQNNKTKIVCLNCGRKIEKTANYCYKCGNKKI